MSNKSSYVHRTKEMIFLGILGAIRKLCEGQIFGQIL